jgi:hypothetical protein
MLIYKSNLKTLQKQHTEAIEQFNYCENEFINAKKNFEDCTNDLTDREFQLKEQNMHYAIKKKKDFDEGMTVEALSAQVDLMLKEEVSRKLEIKELTETVKSLYIIVDRCNKTTIVQRDQMFFSEFHPTIVQRDQISYSEYFPS